MCFFGIVLKCSLYIFPKYSLELLPLGIQTHSHPHRLLINKRRKGHLIQELFVGWEERDEDKVASTQTLQPQWPGATPKYRGAGRGGNLRSSSLSGDNCFVVR